VPTSLGMRVYDILTSSPFAPLLSEEASRVLEESLDKIEQGDLKASEFVVSVKDEITQRLKEAGFALNLGGP